jgi:hypothetical protein
MTEHFVSKYKICPAKFSLIPTFAQLPKLKPESPLPDIRAHNGWESNTILCYSGSLEGWQCFDDIVKLFGTLSLRSSKFRFVFLSKSSREMRDRIGQLVQSHLFVVYSASPSELPTFLSQCDYGFLVRRPHLINRVAAPIKIKDYLLAGLKIVVTTELGDTSLFVEKWNCGVTLEYTDIVSGSIDHSLFEEQVSIPRKAEISKTTASEFSIELASEKHRNLYQEILTSKLKN